MTHAYSEELRNDQGQAQIDRLGAAAVLRIFAGTRPAFGGAETTLLANIPLANPVGSVAAGVVTYTPPATVQAVATGTAAWARIQEGDGTPQIDMDVTQGGADLSFDSTAFVSGGDIVISSLTVTLPNA